MNWRRRKCPSVSISPLSLHFLILPPFPHFLPISSQPVYKAPAGCDSLNVVNIAFILLCMFRRRIPFQIMRWKTVSYILVSFLCLYLMRENIKKLRPYFRARRSPKFLAKNRFSVTSVRYYIIYIMQNAVM